VKYAYELVILDMGEKVLQGMTCSLVEDESSGAMEVNVDRLR